MEFHTRVPTCLLDFHTVRRTKPRKRGLVVLIVNRYIGELSFQKCLLRYLNTRQDCHLEINFPFFLVNVGKSNVSIYIEMYI